MSADNSLSDRDRERLLGHMRRSLVDRPVPGYVPDPTVQALVEVLVASARGAPSFKEGLVRALDALEGRSERPAVVGEALHTFLATQWSQHAVPTAV